MIGDINMFFLFVWKLEPDTEERKMRTGKTGAERTQRYREILKGDPEKREEVLRKRRERYIETIGR